MAPGYYMGAAAKRRGSLPIIVYGKYNDLTPSFDLDYVRDGGNKTPATTGSPAISATSKLGAGSLRLDATPEYLSYTGAGIVDGMTTEGCVEGWFRPQYSGAPGSTLYYWTICKAHNSIINYIEIFHHTNNNLYSRYYNSAGVYSHSVDGTFNPTSGTWYHICVSFNFTGVNSKSWLFLDGTQLDYVGDKSPLRDSQQQLLRIGGSYTGGPTPNCYVDDIRIYDKVYRTGAFTPPTTELSI